MDRSAIDRVMAKLDTGHRRTQKQDRNALAVTLFQCRIGVDVQLDDPRAEASRKRGNGSAHVVTQVAVGAYQQCQNGTWIHRCVVSRLPTRFASDPLNAHHGVALASMQTDRKSTRLNSSHTVISYAVFCLKKKKVVEKPSAVPVCLAGYRLHIFFPCF